MANQDTGTVDLTNPFEGTQNLSLQPDITGPNINLNDERPVSLSNTDYVTQFLARSYQRAQQSLQQPANPLRTTGLTRSPNNNGITTIPDLADINITSSIRRLDDSTTYFTVVPSYGDPQSVISKSEVQAALDYRNSFKSGSPITEYVNFFKGIESKYFSGSVSLADLSTSFSTGDFSGFSNDSILFWIKKYYALPELTKFISAPNSFYRSTWSRSTFNAIHLKFILERYKSSTKSFFKSFSDSVGMVANCKYHQLDSTQPIFDISQDNYGVPIPFSANMENKVGPTARNLMHDLSRYTTTYMRRNLTQIAYYNASYIKNMKVSSRVAHGCNLINDIAFFVDFAKKTQTRVDRIKNKFNGFNNKLYSFIQYISNIGNRSGMNLRDIYAPIDGYDRDFTVTPGSTTIAAQNVNADTNARIDAQLNELEQFALADQSISRRLYEDTARLRYLGSTQVVWGGGYTPTNGTDYYDVNYDSGTQGVTEPEGPYLPPVEPPLPEWDTPQGDNTGTSVLEETNPDGTSRYIRLDTGEELTDEQATQWIIARDNAIAAGSNEIDAGGIADGVLFGEVGVPDQSRGVTQPNQNLTTTRGTPYNRNFGATAFGLPEIDKVTASDLREAQSGNPAYRGFDPTRGSSGREYVPAYSVASRTLPAGTIIKVTDKVTNQIVGGPYNPSGIYRVDGTGGPQTAANLDFFSGNNREMFNYYAGFGTNSNRLQIEIVSGNVNSFEEGEVLNQLNASATPYNPDISVARPQEIPVNQGEGIANIIPPESFNQEITAPEFTLAGNSVTGITASPAEQAAAVNYASQASSRPYSNRQRMVPFAFQIRVEDIDGKPTFLTVDYLLKKVVQDNFNLYKRIDTLRALLRQRTTTDPSVSPEERGQQLSTYDALLAAAGFDLKKVISTGNINQALALIGVNPATTEYGQLFSLFSSVVNQNAITSQTLSQGFGAFLGLGAERLPTNVLGAITNNASLYDSLASQINSLGATNLLPSFGDAINLINPFNYIDINISGIVPQVSLGSLDDVMKLTAGLATAGPPTTIGEALDIAEQIKNIICEFELPGIPNWPIMKELIRLKFNPKDIQRAIQKELIEIGDRLKDLFSWERIYKTIEQSVVGYFTSIYKRLLVCDEKASTDASGQEDAGQIVAPKDN